MMKLYRLLYAIYMQFVDVYLSIFKYKTKFSSGELAQLNSVGWVDVSKMLSSEDIADIVNTEAVLLDKVRSNFSECRGRVYDFHTVQKIPESLNLKMNLFAQEYFNNRSVDLDQTQFQLSMSKTDFTPLGQGWHVDDHRRILKFFLYTTPVNENNGAMSYIQRSHLKKHRAKKFLWDWTKDLKHTYFEDTSQYPKSDFLKLSGDRFSMFAVDTAGLHSANSLVDGERIVFVFNFREIRYEPTSFRKLLKRSSSNY